MIFRVLIFGIPTVSIAASFILFYGVFTTIKSTYNPHWIMFIVAFLLFLVIAIILASTILFSLYAMFGGGSSSGIVAGGTFFVFSLTGLTISFPLSAVLMKMFVKHSSMRGLLIAVFTIALGFSLIALIKAIKTTSTSINQVKGDHKDSELLLSFQMDNSTYKVGDNIAFTFTWLNRSGKNVSIAFKETDLATSLFFERDDRTPLPKPVDIKKTDALIKRDVRKGKTLDYKLTGKFVKKENSDKNIILKFDSSALKNIQFDLGEPGKFWLITNPLSTSTDSSWGRLPSEEHYFVVE